MKTSFCKRKWAMSGKHTKESVEKFIKSVRELSPNMDYVCTHGSCYKFYEILSFVFPGAIGYINAERSHVVTRIGDDLYDISGRIGSALGKKGQEYHEMDAGEHKMARKWKTK